MTRVVNDEELPNPIFLGKEINNMFCSLDLRVLVQVHLLGTH